MYHTRYDSLFYSTATKTKGDTLFVTSWLGLSKNWFFPERFLLLFVVFPKMTGGWVGDKISPGCERSVAEGALNYCLPAVLIKITPSASIFLNGDL